MVHSDDRGVVWSPKVAPIQVVVVPVPYKDKDNSGINSVAKEITQKLQDAGFRVHLDDREGYNPGNKYSHWELRGVPLRIEIGPDDFENHTYVLSRRDSTKKEDKITGDQKSVVEAIKKTLDVFHNDLFKRAKEERDKNIIKVTEWKNFVPTLQNKQLVLAPHCDQTQCELDIKKKSGDESKQFEEKKKPKKKQQAKKDENKNESTKETSDDVTEALTGAAKILCKPLDQEPLNDVKCVGCSNQAKTWALFGRSY